jgi:hypothetical protein
MRVPVISKGFSSESVNRDREQTKIRADKNEQDLQLKRNVPFKIFNLKKRTVAKGEPQNTQSSINDLAYVIRTCNANDAVRVLRMGLEYGPSLNLQVCHFTALQTV